MEHEEENNLQQIALPPERLAICFRETPQGQSSETVPAGLACHGPGESS
jgi:hypothetical protein